MRWQRPYAYRSAVTITFSREWSRGDAGDIDGQAERPNAAYGKSDIEGKTAREAASELGKERVSNGREHMSQRGQRTSFNGANGMSERHGRCVKSED